MSKSKPFQSYRYKLSRKFAKKHKNGYNVDFEWFSLFFAFFTGAFISITLEPHTFTHQVRTFYKDETKLFNIL